MFLFLFQLFIPFAPLLLGPKPLIGYVPIIGRFFWKDGDQYL